MPVIEYADGQIELDDEGYLVNPEAWNEKIAQALAEKEGIKEFTDEMMEIVRFMREYYNKFKAFPILNYVCKNIHQPRNCVTEEFMDPMKAWKIAGLAKPSGVRFVALDTTHKHYILEECC